MMEMACARLRRAATGRDCRAYSNKVYRRVDMVVRVSEGPRLGAETVVVVM